jgi:low temperature requirement protein LtrA
VVSRHFRQRNGEEQRATWLELFFDLVYVFAVTQISTYLLAHYTWRGAFEALVLLLVVWWAWIYTTWMANWFDPDAVPVRLVLVTVMLLSLLMSVSIPTAFGENGLLFAASYAALQVFRNGFNVAVADRGSAWRASFTRILAWSVLVAPIWIAGGLVEGRARLLAWLLALGLDYLGPAVRYWTPGLGKSPVSDWQIEGAHFAERFQLFIIIALGESIVVTGATASRTGVSGLVVAALSVAFAGSVALWWLYFDRVAVHAQARMLSAPDRERLGRDAYTYLHIPIVAGIILVAVGDEIAIAHPMHVEGVSVALAIAGGPALYLLGHQLFRLRMTGTTSGARWVAIAALLATVLLGGVLAPLGLAISATGVLVLLVAYETRERLGSPVDSRA